MATRFRLIALVLCVGMSALARAQQAAPGAATALSVVSAGPTGELGSVAQAAEIRVRFSEPMVPIGRLPEQVPAPFFSVRPAIAGTFRWAGPTILVFTPDPAKALPNATRYVVTIATGATAVSGRRLPQPFAFAFTTPTVHLLRTNWYRQSGRYDQPIVVALRFNQAVHPADVAAHVTFRYQRYEWRAPRLSQQERARIGAVEAARFDAKAAVAAATAASIAPVTFHVAPNWDPERFASRNPKLFAPSPDLVVLQSDAVPSTDGHLLLTADTRLAGVEGPAVPPRAQTQTIVLEPTLFVDGPTCRAQCNADDYNPTALRRPVAFDRLRAAISVRDITVSGRDVVVSPGAQRQTPRSRQETLRGFTIEDVGFDRQPPAKTYAVTVDAGLQSLDGQVLGYAGTVIVENWHDRAFTSFGDGHGVWETGGGPLPFYARNFTDVWQWASALKLDQLMPTILQLTKDDFHTAPSTAGVHRALGLTADAIQSHGLDLSKALLPSGTGLVWAAVKRGQPVEHARTFGGDIDTVASIVQVTNLGISVKDSPQNTLVFVTRLDNGAPVGGADVSIIRTDNKVFWAGRTDDQGIAIAPQTRLRVARDQWKFAFIVTAQKGDDVAYVGSDWNEGISPYEFGTGYDLTEADALLRGTVFTDRGVYKLGEEVHFKGVLRSDSASGIQLIRNGTPLYVALHDSRGKVIDRRTVAMNQWSTTEWTAKLPADGALGDYQVVVSLDKKALEDTPAPPPDSEEGDVTPAWRASVRGSFLVAAYRRPDFRVDANLAGDPPIVGSVLKGVVTARYLFGAAMAKRPVAWSYSRSPIFSAPAAIADKYPFDRFVFVGCCDPDFHPQQEQIASKSGTLDAKGQIALELETRPADGIPFQYSLEGDVEDVSRQHIAGRASFLVHPASWYIGLQRPSGMFVEQKDGLKTSVVAVSPSGVAVPGVTVEIAVSRVQWNSVRRAEGSGFYTWETERKEIDAGHFTVTTGTDPVPLSIPLTEGGSFLVKATARENGQRSSTTRMSFYALGTGYTAWARYDHNRIDLVPERETYKPGETARLMIQSPWEKATALLTVEREGVRSHTQFALTSTQQTVTVPITAADIPNIYVSVLLVKGRTKVDGPPGAEDSSDPGKPSFRLGYAKLTVDDASKRLSVSVKANKDEFRPAGTAKVDLLVKDARGLPVSSEVTLWAVDYGVLSLTGYRTPDVLGSVYVHKALQVMNTDSRQRIVSRRVLTPKGSGEGGGGGVDSGVSELRKDFRVLAFWLGSVTTDKNGHASTDVKLPESLTTYRIMAVGGDKESRFGSGESEIRINKPVVLKAAFPRFLARGDKAFFGSVVTSQLKEAGTAIVTMKSLDPGVLEIAGDAKRSVQVAAGGSAEVRFDVVARATGRARVQVSVRLGNETDAFEDAIPVEVLATPESVAAYGEAAPDAKQTFVMPAGIVPGFGGLHLELASTALVGLGEGARYVVDYPYGCVEQRSSRALVLALTSDLGDAFKLPGIDAKDLHARAQTSLRELEKFQCPSGGFAFWPGECLTVSPYLTSYVLYVYHVAAGLKYDVNTTVTDSAYKYLEGELAEKPPTNESWWPAYTAWESFAVKVLTEGGRHQDSNINRLYTYLDRMPVFALAYLHDAMAANGETGARLAELRRRMANAVLPEAGSVHVEELSDPYLLWFWNSNVRSTSVVLDTLVHASDKAPEITGMVRWLMAARKNGRWGNTQENAWAMQALVDYYRKYEAQVPNFTALVKLGTEDLVRQSFKGRSTQATTKDVPMAQLSAAAPAGSARDLTVTRDGDGTLFYGARLTYAPDVATLAARDEGFHLQRQYAALTDGQAAAAATTFNAGDLVRVTLSLDLPKERRFVAVTDPVPAGFEPVESWFATTARDVVKTEDEDSGNVSWQDVWRRGTFDHVERHDDQVLLFATRLSEGHHEFSYVVRATTSGSFQIAPARVEAMYEPEIFGRTATQNVEVKK